jgi:hypothetical protein
MKNHVSVEEWVAMFCEIGLDHPFPCSGTGRCRTTALRAPVASPKKQAVTNSSDAKTREVSDLFMIRYGKYFPVITW